MIRITRFYVDRYDSGWRAVLPDAGTNNHFSFSHDTQIRIHVGLDITPGKIPIFLHRLINTQSTLSSSDVFWQIPINNLSGDFTLETTASIPNESTSAQMFLHISGPRLVPDSPLNLVATQISANQIDLKWDAPVNDGGSQITRYDIERNLINAGPQLHVSTQSNETFYSDTSLVAGDSAEYRIIAVNDIGSSPPSNTLLVDVLSSPEPPTNLTVTTISANQIDLKWDAPVNDGGSQITDYWIVRLFSIGMVVDYSMFVSSTTLSYSDTGLSPNTSYNYKIYAQNQFGLSSTFATASGQTRPETSLGHVTAHTSSVQMSPPSPPILHMSNTISDTEINLTWEHPVNDGGSALTGYRIQGKTGNDDFSDIVMIPANSQNYVVPNLVQNTTYKFRVFAINSEGSSRSSRIVKSKTLRTIPSEFIILMPSIGIPCIIDSRKIMDVILLVNSTLVQKAISTNDQNRNYAKEVFGRNLVYKKLEPNQSLSEIEMLNTIPIEASQILSMSKKQSRDKILILPNEKILHLSKSVIKYYKLGMGQSFILLHLRIRLDLSTGLYVLFNKNKDQHGNENEFEKESIALAISKIEKPFENCPMLDDKGITNGLPNNRPIRSYHPFFVPTQTDELKIGHVTDPHIAHRWELIEKKIQGMALSPTSKFVNYNENFKTIFSNHNFDFALLTGDLIDHNRGLLGPMGNDLKFQDGNFTYDLYSDFYFNKNWLLFYELIIRQYYVPIFTLLGNHDYLLNPYSLVPSSGIGKFASFAPDLGLKTAELVSAIPTQIHELEVFSDQKYTHTSELSAAWYFLVINPFQDYSFNVDSFSFLMLDWNVEAAGLYDLSEKFPHPTKSLDGTQRSMIDYWMNFNTNKNKIFSMHAPVYNPYTDTGNQYLLNEKINSGHSTLKYWRMHIPFFETYNTIKKRNLMWGSIQPGGIHYGFRNYLIKTLEDNHVKLVLGGHSHTNRLFQTTAQDSVMLKRSDNNSNWEHDRPMFTVTVSAGPKGYTNETGGGDEDDYEDGVGFEKVPSGYRLIKINNNEILNLDEKNIDE